MALSDIGRYVESGTIYFVTRVYRRDFGRLVHWNRPFFHFDPGVVTCIPFSPAHIS
ncbi:hypothetical protein EPYR_01078 [Erwinia pyrifoliae DSM 12163]|nr:hypothetical protein EPYR_01078 [Erwinia pyrifoliae DSM 12163]